MVRVLFTGGGTGGHVYPIIAVARELQSIAAKENISVELMFAGPSDFNLDLLHAEGIKTFRVPAGKLRRYLSPWLPVDLFKSFIGFFYSLFLVWFLMPDVLFCKGGYGSFNVTLAGRIYAIPVMVHESDTVPGLANRLMGNIASRVAISFPTAIDYFKEYKTAYIGNPIRASILAGDKDRAKTLFNLEGKKKLLLVMGGSQGSVRLNEAVAEAIHELLKTYEVVHQCGTANEGDFIKELVEVYGIDPAKAPDYHIKGFLSEEEEAHGLAAATLVVSRAGAGSIYEIAAAAKPSILVPLPESAGDHQRQNAFFYARTGAAVVIEEMNLSPHILINEINGIGTNGPRQQEMAKAAREFAKPEAAKEIAQGLLELAVG